MTTTPVRIPADVDLTDKVLGPLTARQLAILTVAGLVLYGVWSATRAFVPVTVFLALAIPVGASAALLALGKRDGVSLDRLLLAAIRQRAQPRHQVAAPEGVRPAPAWLTTHFSTISGGTKHATDEQVSRQVRRRLYGCRRRRSPTRGWSTSVSTGSRWSRSRPW